MSRWTIAGLVTAALMTASPVRANGPVPLDAGQLDSITAGAGRALISLSAEVVPGSASKKIGRGLVGDLQDQVIAVGPGGNAAASARVRSRKNGRRSGTMAMSCARSTGNGKAAGTATAFAQGQTGPGAGTRR